MLQEKAELKKVWEKVILRFRVLCEDPEVGMFCTILRNGKATPPSARGGRMTRGIVDWNHAM